MDQSATPPGVFATAASDFADATVQERFLLMLNERVGRVEEDVHELQAMHAMREDVRAIRGMLTEMRDFITTDCVRTNAVVLKTVHPVIDAAFLDKVVEAVQRTPHVTVDTAWAIASIAGGDYNHVRIFLSLKGRVLVERVAQEMSTHLSLALGSSDLHYSHEWWSTSLSIIDNETRITEGLSPFVTKVY